MANTYSQLIAGMAGIARQLVSRVNPATGESVISNWPTQLLGNRPLSGNVKFTIAGKTKNHAIENFMPARDKAGKPSKANVGDFRRNYESGLPEKIASKEFLNLLVYFILSAMTGRLPTPNVKGFSAESTLKASIAHEWLDSQNITVESAIVENSDSGLSVEHSGTAVMGILLAFVENRNRVDSWAIRESSRQASGESLDWESLV
jgi:hypothetical protein